MSCRAPVTAAKSPLNRDLRQKTENQEGKTMPFETAFSMDTSSIKFGPGVTREIGNDMSAIGARRVMVVTDANLVNSEAVTITLDALRAEGIDAVVYDRTRVEPTSASFQDAIRFATEGNFDGYVA